MNWNTILRYLLVVMTCLLIWPLILANAILLWGRVCLYAVQNPYPKEIVQATLTMRLREDKVEI